MFIERNIKFFYLKIFRRVRNFLLSEKSRKVLIFLFFFFISSGFWLLQTLKNNFEIELAIPVKLKNVPNDAVKLHQHVVVRVTEVDCKRQRISLSMKE
jgi:hypothetical protein